MKQIGLVILAAILMTGQSFSMVECSSLAAQAVAPTNGWLKVEAGAFSIYAPPGWEFHRKRGIDSYVGEFAGSGFALSFDFGGYSYSLDKETEPTYSVVHEIIGGYKAKIVSPRKPGHGVTGAYFPETGGGNKLCLDGRDLTDTQQQVALRIFRTIRFR